MNIKHPFRPMLTSQLGFENLFDELNQIMKKSQEQSSYPPYNVFKHDSGYTVELAVAGFKRDQIQIEHQRKTNQMIVSGSPSPAQDTKPEAEVIRQGIGRRSFSLSFKVADDLEIKDAKLEDGILTISLNTVTREEDAPLLIQIK